MDAERWVVLRWLQRREPRTVRRRVRVERWRVVKGHVWKGCVVGSTLQPGVVHPVVVHVPRTGVLLDDVVMVPVLPRVEDVRPLPADLALVEPGVVVAAEQAVSGALVGVWSCGVVGRPRWVPLLSIVSPSRYELTASKSLRLPSYIIGFDVVG